MVSISCREKKTERQTFSRMGAEEPTTDQELRVELLLLDRRFVERDHARARGVVAPPLVAIYEDLSEEMLEALDRCVAGTETETTEIVEEAVSIVMEVLVGELPCVVAGELELPSFVFRLVAVEQQRELQQRERLDVYQHWELGGIAPGVRAYCSRYSTIATLPCM